jgi:3-oxoacyl-(acyl-carrier-protein) synthase/2-polyprenyl-6-methoxyphenol hydroxylase-like FAD-dependent oxidoreductase
MTRREILRALQAHEISFDTARELLLDGSSPPGARPGWTERFSAPDETGARGEEIAIVSVAGRFPGAPDVETFWENLASGRDCITEIPQSRWNYRKYYSPAKGVPGTLYCKWGGFIDEVDCFDPLFFRISPREARLIDPQERISLEVVWELLERIGYTRTSLTRRYGGKVGVFTGSMYHQYHALGTDFAIEASIAMSSHASIANRISHFFGCAGPSIALDTMCSSGGTAIHLACESILRGECSLAIAGAANLSIHPYKYIALSQSLLLASSDQIRGFGDTDGFIPGEAVAAVLLKKLDRAVEDGDPILAVIKSSAVNHKGCSDGFSAPSAAAIADVMARNHAKSGVDPATIGYIECAASGAPLADAAEFDALTGFYGVPAAAAGSNCVLGTVKGNIGHTEASAGICQLIKVALQLHHGYFVPTIKAEPLNPNIRLAGSSFRLEAQFRPWRQPIPGGLEVKPHRPRRAAIVTTGAGGSNNHLILEEYHPKLEYTDAPLASRGPQVFVFSAKTDERLTALMARMAEHIAKNPALELDSMAWTLQLGREEMNSRAAFVARDGTELKHGIEQCLAALESGGANSTRSVSLHNLGSGPSSPECVLPEVVGRVKSDRNLAAIAEAWTRGARIDWKQLHANAETAVRQAFKILPTYPFARVRCWTPAKVPEAGAAPREAPRQTEAGGDVQDGIIREIAKLAGMEPAGVNPDTPLSDLGLNSVSRLVLAANLCRVVPSLDETRDGARLIACSTAAELAACIHTVGDGKPEQTSRSGYSFLYRSTTPNPAPEEFSSDSAVVIGGGPAGLMAALTLKKSGFDPVLVVEKRKRISRMHMITLYQQTLPYLKFIGVLAGVVARSSPIRHHDFYSNRCGRRTRYYSKTLKPELLEGVDEHLDYAKERAVDHFAGESVLAISLADLQDALMREALDAGVLLTADVNATVERASAADRWSVRVERNEDTGGAATRTVVLDPALIVIADGLKSQNAQRAGVEYDDTYSPRGTEYWYVFHCTTDRRQSSLCYEFSFNQQSELTDCAFGLFYPQRSEFGVALYCASADPPSAAFLREKAEFFAASQAARFDGIKWQTRRIEAHFTLANRLAFDNIVLAGDAAGTGSPNAGMGAVLGISAYPWALKEYCARVARNRQDAIAFYNDTATGYARNWQDRSRYIWSRILDLTNLPDLQ